MRIIFMGTPDFAVPALSALIDSEHDVVAVYTKEPKPTGRGYEVLKSKIHLVADEAGIQVLTPKNFKSPEDVEQFAALKPDIAVVAAYGLLLPKSILEIPRYGCINIHPSTLPRWRGAAPIQRTILAGDVNTEVCIMQMDEGMDTGDILLKQEVSIHEQMTSKELHDLAAEISGKLVLDTVSAIAMGAIKSVKQSIDGVMHAAKLTRADELISWQKSAFEIHCQIRAFSPRPGAYFKYNNEVIKIIQAEYIAGDASQFQPGEVVDAELTIACGDGFLKPTLLQREGRKMIYTDAFLRGFPIAPGTLFG